jgi:uncharacterized membrane protein
MNDFVQYIVFAILLLIIDSIWVIGANSIHKNVVNKVQKSPLEVNLIAAVLFYVLASFGYILFIRKLAKDAKSAFLYGFMLGLLMYGTFDLTNKAIFVNYPWTYTLADMTWGSLVFGIVSAIVFNISN